MPQQNHYCFTVEYRSGGSPTKRRGIKVISNGSGGRRIESFPNVRCIANTTDDGLILRGTFTPQSRDVFRISNPLGPDTDLPVMFTLLFASGVSEGNTEARKGQGVWSELNFDPGMRAEFARNVPMISYSSRRYTRSTIDGRRCGKIRRIPTHELVTLAASKELFLVDVDNVVWRAKYNVATEDLEITPVELPTIFRELDKFLQVRDLAGPECDWASHNIATINRHKPRLPSIQRRGGRIIVEHFSRR